MSESLKNISCITRKWADLWDLENQMAAPFSNIDSRTVATVNFLARDAAVKSSFNYLLLDPRLTQNLPSRVFAVGDQELWRVFISALFYIGKGTRSRPFQHLYEAVKKKGKKNVKFGEKIDTIHGIWEAGMGVISLQVFQNTIGVEGFTREAAMIQAMGCSNLSNAKPGDWYGPAAWWSQDQQTLLGTFLLFRAFKIFLQEGERQIRQQIFKIKMDKPVVLENEKGLINKDLNPAYKACGQALPEMPARFKKKEDLSGMARSILKHRIQTLTGKQIKLIEEEMQYKPKDPNELGIDIDIMRSLAHYLILLSNGIPFHIPASREQTPPLASSTSSRKRRPSLAADASLAAEQEPNKIAKTSRRSLATLISTPPVVSRSSRRSIAVSSMAEDFSPSFTLNGSSSSSKSGTPAGWASSGTGSVTSSKETAVVTTGRSGRRSIAGTPSRADVSSSSDMSQAVRCLGPANPDNVLKTVVEVEELGAVNPTPLMKEMIKKRQSLGSKLTPVKSVAAKQTKKESTIPKKNASPPKVATPPPPRQGFQGIRGSAVYLLAGDPLSITHRKVVEALPLAAGFPGANLAVVHTPAEWTPAQMFQIAQIIKKMNRDAGLQSFVFLAGTGLTNVHLNQEALLRHTKHVQFVTFHREDANKEFETGKLRETTSFFLVAYFFPGCDVENSALPEKMVRDGYSTCFRTESAASLEKSIVDCFSETGEWVMDICCGTRKITLEASQQGRSAVAVHADGEALEELGNYLRTESMIADSTYRDTDGLVVNLA